MTNKIDRLIAEYDSALKQPPSEDLVVHATEDGFRAGLLRAMQILGIPDPGTDGGTDG